MSDLIDRQAAIDALDWKWAGNAAIDAIKNLPSEEPDIVLCKNCIWRLGTDCTRFAEVPVSLDDYCSRAERKRSR